MPDADSQDRHPAWHSSKPQMRGLCAALFAIRDPQSKVENSQGGIAQLVERQLCKLEVRGSNPLASKYFMQILKHVSLSDCHCFVILAALANVYAKRVEEILATCHV